MMGGVATTIRMALTQPISEASAADTAVLAAFAPILARRQTPAGLTVTGEPRWHVAKRSVLTEDEIEAGFTLDNPQLLVVEWDVVPVKAEA